MSFQADSTRYDRPEFYTRCGNSGLKLPLLSLGLWHNFGDEHALEGQKKLIRHAFDHGITHFDLANNYGPPAGASERNFGRILQDDFASYRDELIISSKAGYEMWAGPYGDFGSRKYLMASLEQSLRRLGLDYVDIFYHHRPDPETPLTETMGALTDMVRQGKALYIGLSNYGPERTREAAQLLRAAGTPCLIHQPKYSMLMREPENGLFDVLRAEGIGCIPFSPLAQGMLTERYLDGIPADSRAASGGRFLKAEHLDAATVAKLRSLKSLADGRGQTLAQMALAWVLRQPAVTTVLIGASKVSQIDANLGAAHGPAFADDELKGIDQILAG